MKLNVGCGDQYAPGWTNLDTGRDQHRQPDVIGDLLHLPDELDGLEQVYCGHVLEHLTLVDAEQALRVLHARTAIGGRLLIVGPDVRRARQLHRAGLLDDLTLHGAIHGAGRWAGDEHLWECETDLLLALLARAGWYDALPLPVRPETLAGWPVTSFAPWQCAVTATRLP